MKFRSTLVERAFDLASDGTCVSLKDIRRTLRREQYLVSDIELTLAGVSLRRQLRQRLLQRATPIAERGNDAGHTAAQRPRMAANEGQARREPATPVGVYRR